MLGGRVMPTTLLYAPPAYPGHDYLGTGEVVTVCVGREVVGHLTRKGWTAEGFIARPGLSPAADTVRVMVHDILATHAAAGHPLGRRVAPHTTRCTENRTS